MPDFGNIQVHQVKVFFQLNVVLQAFLQVCTFYELFLYCKAKQNGNSEGSVGSACFVVDIFCCFVSPLKYI